MSLDGSDVGDTPGPTGGPGVRWHVRFSARRRRGRVAQADGGAKPRGRRAGASAHGAWDHGLDQSAEGRAKREAAIAKACGVDMHALGMARARQEALQSIFC